MKALKILKKYGGLINQYTMDLVSKDISEAIEELGAYITNNQGIKRRLDNALNSLNALKNNSCNGCKHLENREELLKNSCLIEVCRSCKRSNIDRWEQK